MSINTLAFVTLAGITISYLYLKVGKHGLGLLGAALLIVLGYAFFVVHSISSSPTVATVRCVEAANAHHTMLVTLSISGEAEAYEMSGDRWMLQNSIVTVSPLLAFLGGGKSGYYTLDRLNSQFDDDQAHSQKPVELGGWSLYKNTSYWRYVPFLITSAYGNAVIEPCDNTTYTIRSDSSGEMYAERSK